MMTKSLFPLVVSAGILAILAASCQAPALELIQEPAEPGTEVVPEWTTIPYSLSVSTGKTRVATDQDAKEYQFKSGDKIRVTGTDRTDISGELSLDNEDHLWKGQLSYRTNLGGPVSGSTELEVTLIHADNQDASTYASAVVGTGSGEGWVSEADFLKHAVEHYSLFTATYTYDSSSTGSVELTQRATFLDCTITFKFDGSHEVGGGGNAKVDLITTRGEMRTDSAFSRVGESHDYKVRFMAVVPGGQTKDAFTLTVADRAIAFTTTDALASNMLYTVKRDIIYGPQLGDPYWSDGTYGRMDPTKYDESKPKPTIIGIIVYVNRGFPEGTPEANIDKAITEKTPEGLYGQGLVMALHNVAVGAGGVGDLWGADNGVRWCLSGGNGVLRTGTTIQTPSATLGISALNGLANTNAIVSALGPASAAYLAQHYLAAPESSTGWFLPSIGQWLYTISIDGFGGADHASTWNNNNGKNWLTQGQIGDLVRVMNNSGSSENLLVKSLNDRLETLKSQFARDDNNFYDAFGWSVNDEFGDNYWTSTEFDANNAFRMNLGSVEPRNGSVRYSTIKPKNESKTSTYTYKQGFIMRIRPFLAF